MAKITLADLAMAENKPNEAIALLKSSAQSISLLTTDVVMPQLNGRELRDRLQAEIPTLVEAAMHAALAQISQDIRRDARAQNDAGGSLDAEAGMQAMSEKFRAGGGEIEVKV